MKYASEVIDLMECMPGRRFKVREVVNSVVPKATVQQRASIREGIRRVLISLERSGHVGSTRGEIVNGADAEYWWKPQHEVIANRNGNRNNTNKPSCAYKF